MDYRNADGSVAEMCGNGVRVFARYLAHAGLLPGGAAAELPVGTRGGVRRVWFAGGDGARRGGRGRHGPGAGRGRLHRDASTGTRSPASRSTSGTRTWRASPTCRWTRLDLALPPGHDPALFPHGVNVEFVTPLGGDDGAGIRMRVHERGVGETRSCGTGTVAAVVAALLHRGDATGSVPVRTRGGNLRVTVDAATTTLHGPAVLVAGGELAGSWWESLS